MRLKYPIIWLKHLSRSRHAFRLFFVLLYLITNICGQSKGYTESFADDKIVDTDEIDDFVSNDPITLGKESEVKPLKLFFAKNEEQNQINNNSSNYQSRNKILINLTISVIDGWSIYASDSLEGYPLKITVDQQNKHIESIQILWPQAKEKIDNVLGQEVHSKVYQGEFVIPIILKIKKDFLANNINLSSRNFISAILSDLILDIEYGACGNGCIMGQEKIKYNDGLILTNQMEDLSIEAPMPEQEQDQGLYYISILLMAIAGGFILNFMPCVLPIISLKIFHFVKYSKFNKKQIRLNLLLIAGGILLFFWCLSIVTILLKESGTAVGWGMHFQEPGFIAILVSVLLLLSLNMLGLFEITLSSSIYTKLANLGVNSIYVNSVLSGFLISALATPCTAPFLSTAVTFAITQNYSTIYLVYTSIALGMSLPYLFIAITPKAIRLLPKPGPWMVNFRRILALPLIAAAVWLLYVLYIQVGLIALWLVLSILTILAMLFLLKTNFFIRGVIAVLALLIFLNKMSYHDIVKIEGYGLENIHTYIERNQLVLVNITADWCLTCKFNEALVIKDNEIRKMLQDNDVVFVQADYTKKSRQITQYLSEYKRYGIPLSVIYGPAAKQGIILPEVLSKQVLVEAIKQAKGNLENYLS